MALSKSALSDLLDAVRAGGDLDVIREALAMVLQALIEAEAAQQIGADRYERSASRTTHRNGSRARLLSIKAGDVELRILTARSTTWSRPWAWMPGSPSPRSAGSAPGWTVRWPPFRSRPLAHTCFPYLFVDATYLKARVDGRVVSRW